MLLAVSCAKNDTEQVSNKTEVKEEIMNLVVKRLLLNLD